MQVILTGDEYNALKSEHAKRKYSQENYDRMMNWWQGQARLIEVPEYCGEGPYYCAECQLKFMNALGQPKGGETCLAGKNKSDLPK